MTRGGQSTRLGVSAPRGYSSEVSGADLFRLSDDSKTRVFRIDGDGLIVPSNALNGGSPPTGQSIIRRSYGGTSNPKDGDVLHDLTEQTLFAYDGGRSKWLSAETHQYTFSRAAAEPNGVYCRMTGGGAGAANYGYRVPWEMTLIGYGFSCPSATTATLQIRRNGTSLGTIGLAAATNQTDTAMDIDVGTRGSLTVFVNVGTIASRYLLTLYAKRKIS